MNSKAREVDKTSLALFFMEKVKLELLQGI